MSIGDIELHQTKLGFSIERKIEVVTNYLVLGNIRQVSAVTGVAYSTIKLWRTQPWWKDIEAEILAGKRLVQVGKLSKIVDKSLDVIEDRLENGDIVLNNKTGELVRKPVSLRDVSTTANGLMQRQAIIEKLQLDTKQVDTTASINDQLKALAEQFAKMNNRGKASATDVEFTEVDNALYDQRETRLQEGSGEVYEPAFSNQEAFGTERSPESDGEERVGT